MGRNCHRLLGRNVVPYVFFNLLGVISAIDKDVLDAIACQEFKRIFYDGGVCKR